jgi:hypothetical protein
VEVRIDFHKGPSTRYRSTLHRRDGVLVALEGGSWNKIGGRVGRVPHDLAHLIVEQELGLRSRLWGVLARGGLVQNAELVGRRPPHARERAVRIADAAQEELRQAEIIVRAVAVAGASLEHRIGDADGLRRAMGERWWHPAITREAFTRIDAGLRSAAEAWHVSPPGETLNRSWRL